MTKSYIWVTAARPPFQAGAVFLNQYGRPYQKGGKLNIVFRRCQAEPGIHQRTGPYPWRYTYASIGITEQVEPALLASQLGHRLETLCCTCAQAATW